jgi:hypothetical protein
MSADLGWFNAKDKNWVELDKTVFRELVDTIKATEEKALL